MNLKRLRTRFSAALSVSAIVFAFGVAVLTLSESPETTVASAGAIIASWMIPAFYAIRYHSRLSMNKLARATDIQRSQREIISKLDTLRAKESRHEYVQERSLERIESDIQELQRNVAVTPMQFGQPGIDVLFVTSNGAGLGHISRLIAISNEFSDSTAYEFLTLSSAYSRVASKRHKINYFPSADAANETVETWNRAFQEYFHQLVHEVRPRIVVFDGTWVYRGITNVCRGLLVPLVWVQRGMWKSDVDKASIQRHNAREAVDYVIIPGDYAGTESVDLGYGIEPIYVGPIVNTRNADLLSREAACASLGLDPSQRHALINLGNAPLGQDQIGVSETLAALREFAPTLHPVQVVSPLAVNSSRAEDHKTFTAFPVMNYARAFDVMIAACGYNSSQEAVALGIPTIFLPNLSTLTDDQHARAVSLERQGLGISAVNIDQLSTGVERICSLDSRRTMLSKLAGAKRADGAVHAAAAIEKIGARARWVDQATPLAGLAASRRIEYPEAE